MTKSCTNKPHSSNCRFCASPLTITFADLGMSPLANSYVRAGDQHRGETFFPLHARVCAQCYLVQLDEFESAAGIFEEYAYFSSFSESWLSHARHYTEMAKKRFALNQKSQVIEIASNDGYLLQYFREQGIPVLGIEPAKNMAEVANSRGIPTRSVFFNTETAKQLCLEGIKADLVVANNVLAHVPNLNDFVASFKLVLKPEGIATFEFPHLLRLIESRQFDTIYHEHFSYLSLLTLREVFAHHGLKIFDVTELPTHGGSLRIFVTHKENDLQVEQNSVKNLISRERAFGLDDLALYQKFANEVIEVKCSLLSFLLSARRDGASVVGYGAPAKGNTLLNYCGVGPEFISYTVDRNPEKQNTLLPGVRIPVFSPDRIRETKPNFIVVLPWNLIDEITDQMSFVREWGCKFVVPIPEVKII